MAPVQTNQNCSPGAMKSCFLLCFLVASCFTSWLWDSLNMLSSVSPAGSEFNVFAVRGVNSWTLISFRMVHHGKMSFGLQEKL